MRDDILYHRLLPHGPAVRIRRTSSDGSKPVVAVLEVDRRAGTPREDVGDPPPLLQCEGASEQEVVESLEACYGLSGQARTELSAKAREHALRYDADLVLEQYWLPALDEIERRLADRRPLRIAPRAA